jgi:hypothetical protein
MPLRSFQCPLTEEPCFRPDCKKSQCIDQVLAFAEAQESRKKTREDIETYIRNNLREEAESIARSLLRQAKKPMTAMSVATVSQLPRVIEIAKSNLRMNAEHIQRALKRL